MKLLIIQGSPKKKGKTASTVNKLKEQMAHMGHEAVVAHIGDYDIGGCKGCMGCMTAKGPDGCVIKDDAHKLFAQMTEADGIVYASPLYGWDFTGQMKLLLDRHFSLVKGYHTPDHQSFIADKKSAFLFTCMGPDGEPNTDILNVLAQRLSKYMKLDSKGMYVLSGSMKPDFDNRGDELVMALCQDLLG